MGISECLVYTASDLRCPFQNKFCMVGKGENIHLRGVKLTYNNNNNNNNNNKLTNKIFSVR